MLWISRRSLSAAVVAALLGAVPVVAHGQAAELDAPARAFEAPLLTLSLADLGSVPSGTLARVREIVVESFRTEGIEVAWVPYPDEKASARIILTPSDPMAWGLGGEVMGISLGGKREQPAVYVFLGVVARMVGERFVTGSVYDSVGRVRFTRALARIVAHETVHALAPWVEHTEDGLMAIEHRSRELWESPLKLEGRVLEALRGHLRDLAAR